MKRKNTALILMAGAVFASAFSFAALPHYNAAASEPATANVTKAGDQDIQPMLFTNIALGLDGGDGKVWATASNDFTLFSTTVNVVVQLYCSTTYCEDYNKMELVSMNSIEDLDQGHTITTECSTGGEQKYWIGRARYRENYGDWKELTIGPGLFSASGKYLGLT